MGENSRAAYGVEIIKKLSKELSETYGKGFTKTNLYSFYSFYKCLPEIFHPVSGKSQVVLSWTHYRTLLQVADEKAKAWYAKEVAEQTWNVRTLQRNISSQYYNRMLKSPNSEAVEKEMKEINMLYLQDRSEFIKNPGIYILKKSLHNPAGIF